MVAGSENRRQDELAGLRSRMTTSKSRQHQCSCRTTGGPSKEWTVPTGHKLPTAQVTEECRVCRKRVLLVENKDNVHRMQFLGPRSMRSALDVLEVGEGEEGYDAEGDKEAEQPPRVLPHVIARRLRGLGPVVPHRQPQRRQPPGVAHWRHAEILRHILQAKGLSDHAGGVGHQRTPRSRAVEGSVGERSDALRSRPVAFNRHRTILLVGEAAQAAVELRRHGGLESESRRRNVEQELPWPGNRRFWHEEAW
eukprot:2833328-Rhodomonas_salina.1